MTAQPGYQRSPGVAPARRRRFDLRRPTDRATAVAVGVAAGLAFLILSPDLGPGPGDPSRFAADARLVRCGGAVAPVQYAFEVPLVSDYQSYLPAMEQFSELELARPALIVIFRDLGPFGVTVGPSGSPGPTRSPGAGLHDVCIYVGEAGAGELNFYTDVSTSGLRVRAGGPAIEP